MQTIKHFQYAQNNVVQAFDHDDNVQQVCICAKYQLLQTNNEQKVGQMHHRQN